MQRKSLEVAIKHWLILMKKTRPRAWLTSYQTTTLCLPGANKTS